MVNQTGTPPGSRKDVPVSAPEHSEAIRRYFFNPLSTGELETLATVFDRMLDNVAPSEL